MHVIYVQVRLSRSVLFLVSGGERIHMTNIYGSKKRLKVHLFNQLEQGIFKKTQTHCTIFICNFHMQINPQQTTTNMESSLQTSDRDLKRWQVLFY